MLSFSSSDETSSSPVSTHYPVVKVLPRSCLLYIEGLPSELHRPLPLSLSAARDRDNHTNPSPTLSTLSFAFFSEFVTFVPNPFGLSRFIPSPFPKSAHLMRLWLLRTWHTRILQSQGVSALHTQRCVCYEVVNVSVQHPPLLRLLLSSLRLPAGAEIYHGPSHWSRATMRQSGTFLYSYNK